MTDHETVEAVRRYLADWEASYGMDRLPDHWGITQRIRELNALLPTPSALAATEDQ